MTVSRKVGKAVVRNALKRRLREFFRTHKSELPPADLVIVAKPGSAGMSFHQISQELSFLKDPRTSAKRSGRQRGR